MLYSPKWSKAKKRLKSFTCESLSSRVDFQVIKLIKNIKKGKGMSKLMDEYYKDILLRFIKYAK